MPLQEPISPGQIKPESCREPETSSRLQQTNANLQAPRNGVHGYTILAVRDYQSSGNTARVDRLRTAGEVEVELRQSVQAPEPRYRFGLNVAIVEAIHGLYDPNFRSQFRPETLRKLDVGFRKAIEEMRQSSGEALVDLEKGVMPGEGDEYADLPT